MADTLWFSNDYHDMSVEWGQDAGFQFEFYCQRCRDTWRSAFDPYRAARAAGWIRRASNTCCAGTDPASTSSWN